MKASFVAQPEAIRRMRFLGAARAPESTAGRFYLTRGGTRSSHPPGTRLFASQLGS
jgi:hypothetical protein